MGKSNSMKVYRFSNNVNEYKYFLTENEKDGFHLFGDCQPKVKEWKAPPVFIYKPLLKAGALYDFGVSMPIFSPFATEVLRTYLEMAGELLPLPHQSEVYTALNVTECINCLDHEKTIWIDPTKPYLGIKKYVFHPNRFSESLIFKIPETHRSEVLVLEPAFMNVPLPDYLAERGIEGVLFEQLWEAE